MSLRVLLVDASAANLSALKTAIGPLAAVDAVSDFPSARELLRSTHYDRLVSNFRLGAYNGVHLAYVADPGTRSIIYTEQPESWCSREVQSAGAIYEHRAGLQRDIAAYLDDPTSVDQGHGEAHPAGSGDRAATAPESAIPLPAIAPSAQTQHWIF